MPQARRCDGAVSNALHTMVILLGLLGAGCAAAAPGGPPTWRKVVVDPAFRSEAVSVADVDRDGDLDLFFGDGWYEAPQWQLRAIRTLGDHKDGAATYSNCFACFGTDVDRDGWVDQVVVGIPGTPCHWYRNPAGGAGPWECFEVHPSACNESVQLVDLFGDGKPVLLMGDGSRLVWCEPGVDPRTPWSVHSVSGPDCPAAVRFAHGLGTGDMDRDGRLDVVTPHGWWRQPEGARTRSEPWEEHRIRTCFDSAHLHVLDVDADGLVDVLNSSAHARGICWNPQRVDEAGKPFFTVRMVADHVTQTHALCFVDIDGDGHRDLVTGKRWWAHGPQGDIDPMGTPWLLWIRVVPGPEPVFEVHPIDDSSGVGTHFEVADVDGNGLLDVVVANKRGVHVMFQERAP